MIGLALSSVVAIIFAVLLVISLRKQRKNQNEEKSADTITGISCIIQSILHYLTNIEHPCLQKICDIYRILLGTSIDKKVGLADDQTRKSTDSNYMVNQNYKIDLELEVSGNPYYCNEIGKGVSQAVESATKFPQNIEIMKTVDNVYYE